MAVNQYYRFPPSRPRTPENWTRESRRRVGWDGGIIMIKIIYINKRSHISSTAFHKTIGVGGWVFENLAPDNSHVLVTAN